jgi:hypothetical protein
MRIAYVRSGDSHVLTRKGWSIVGADIPARDDAETWNG